MKWTLFITLAFAVASCATCESFQTSALGLRGISKSRMGLSEAEMEVIRRLKSFGGIVRVMDFRYWGDVKREAWRAEPMTIFLIDGPYEVWLYFRDHEWELLPFRLNGRWIVRKMRASA